MEIILLLARLFLTVIFGVAGFSKLADRNGTEKAIVDFGMPQSFSKPLAIILPIVEILIAFALIPIETALIGSLVALVLLTVFILAMLMLIFEGKSPNCNCFGQTAGTPVSWKSVLRNIAFALVGGFVFLNGNNGNLGLNILGWLKDLTVGERMQLGIGLGTISLLGFAVYYLKNIAQKQFEIIRRIEVLDFISKEDKEEVREDVALPEQGLLLGTTAPEFSLKDIAGKKQTLSELLKPQKPILLLFVSPNCTPCNSLMPEIEKWENDLSNRVKFVFVSDGKPKENKEKFGSNENRTVLLQSGKEVNELYQAKWTPTAVLINKEGIIASRVATGDKAITELIDSIKQIDEEIDFVQKEQKDGIKIGNYAPIISAKDIEGKELSESLSTDKKTLFVYWGVTCPHCVNMLDDLRQWEKNNNGSGLNMVLLSNGDEEKNKELNLKAPIVLENSSEIATQFGMKGTPSAIIIDQNWKFASEIAVGSAKLLSLVGYKPEKEKE